MCATLNDAISAFVVTVVIFANICFCLLKSIVFYGNISIQNL